MPGSDAGNPTSPNYPSLPQLHLAKESREPGVERRLGSGLLPDGTSVASAGTVPGLCIRVWPRPIEEVEAGSAGADINININKFNCEQTSNKVLYHKNREF